MSFVNRYGPEFKIVADILRLSGDGAAVGDVLAWDGTTLVPTSPDQVLAAATPDTLSLYVHPSTGNDSNDGTENSPLLTHTEALSRVQSARFKATAVITFLATLSLGANPSIAIPGGGVDACAPVLLQGTWVDSGLGTLTATGGTTGTTSPYVPATITTNATLGSANTYQHRRVRCITGPNAGKSFLLGSHTATGSPGTITLEHVLSSAFANGNTFVIEVQTAITWTGTLTIRAPYTGGLRALSLEGPILNLMGGKLGATGCRFKSSTDFRLRARAGVEFVGGGPDFYELFPTSVIAEDNGDTTNAMGNGFAGTTNNVLMGPRDHGVLLLWGTNIVDPFLSSNGGRFDCTRCTFDGASTSSSFRGTFKGAHSETSCRWIGANVPNPAIQADGGSSVTLSAVSFVNPSGTAVAVTNKSSATLGAVTGTTNNASAAIFSADGDSHLQINTSTCTISNAADASKQLKLDGDAITTFAALTAATYLDSSAGGSTAKNGT